MKLIEVIDRKTGKIQRETPPNERLLRFLFHHPLGSLPVHLLIKRKILSSYMGKKMNELKSAKRIQKFVDDFQINMNEARKSIKDYHSFNDFFYRKLKKNARKIEEGFVSPADGKILAFENIPKTKDFFVKGNRFTLDKFLQEKSLATKFENATLVLVRLAPDDYHRFHFPYEGTISATKNIKGHYYSVSPYAVKENFTIFCENKRAYSILNTKDKGDVLISEIGATMVGSIFQTYKNNSKVNKGAEKGYFAFGGSSVLLLIDSNKIKISQDILENTKNGYETIIKMGEQIGE